MFRRFYFGLAVIALASWCGEAAGRLLTGTPSTGARIGTGLGVLRWG